LINESLRVRFAPSPTGALHVGNARTALFNWLFARQGGGNFILRIEDTDQERATKHFEKNLIDELLWLGIDWDEGPGKEGPFGPYHQTERLPIYNANLEKLISMGKAYPCYCSEEELEAERADLIAKRMMPRYMGKCRHLTTDERQRLEQEGRKPAYRFLVERSPIEFDDMIRGVMKFTSSAIGDFIIVRSNGLPAYNFAAVVDDHLMKITHVIRGEDHLSNTAAQILIYQALGFSLPIFAHHSLVLGKDRTKLSKRHGSVPVEEFRKKGILPEVLLNYLSLMGNSFGAGKEICSLDEIIGIFSLENTGRGGAIFDENKLKWMNGIYIRNCSMKKLVELSKPFVEEGAYDESALDSRRLESILHALRGNLSTLSEIKDYLPIFSNDTYKLCPEAELLLKEENALKTLKLFRDVLLSEGIPEDGFYEIAIKKVNILSGLKGRHLFLPIRCAVTGLTQGPELDLIMAVLGKKTVINRLEKAIQPLEKP
jgi:nondiscriminating glutamyl-tRNA synthetase